MLQLEEEELARKLKENVKDKPLQHEDYQNIAIFSLQKVNFFLSTGAITDENHKILQKIKKMDETLMQEFRFLVNFNN